MNHYATHNLQTSKTRQLNNSYKTNTQLLGHRGARGERFENSRQGFEYALNLVKHSNNRLVGIEFDVQLTKDGHLVVFHDETLSRLYRQQARINQLSYREIEQLSAGAHPIMLLTDLAPLLVGYTHIELEIKTHQRTNYRQLVATLAKSLRTKKKDSVNEANTSLNLMDTPITLTSFDVTLHEWLQRHPLLSTLPRGLLVAPKPSTQLPKSLYDIPYLAIRLGCDRIGLQHSLYDQKFMALCTHLNIKTSAWTVNKVADVTKLSALGVNHIITDYPSLMIDFFDD